jgi:hypothetical protein
MKCDVWKHNTVTLRKSCTQKKMDESLPLIKNVEKIFIPYNYVI